MIPRQDSGLGLMYIVVQDVLVRCSSYFIRRCSIFGGILCICRGCGDAVGQSTYQLSSLRAGAISEQPEEAHGVSSWRGR